MYNFPYVRIVEFEISADELKHLLFLIFNNDLPGKGLRPVLQGALAPYIQQCKHKGLQQSKLLGDVALMKDFLLLHQRLQALLPDTDCWSEFHRSKSSKSLVCAIKKESASCDFHPEPRVPTDYHAKNPYKETEMPKRKGKHSPKEAGAKDVTDKKFCPSDLNKMRRAVTPKDQKDGLDQDAQSSIATIPQ
jgi:hypothetical protein